MPGRAALLAPTLYSLRLALFFTLKIEPACVNCLALSAVFPQHSMVEGCLLTAHALFQDCL